MPLHVRLIVGMELTYRAFALALGSELALPGLPVTDDKPGVLIRRAAIPPWQGEPTVQYGERLRVRGQECAVRFKALPFAARITDGNLIEFEADPAKDEISSLHVLGTCAGALLFQRGLLPLHGNTIATPSGAVMVLGRIGSGKSTTTMALLGRGHRLVADDISPVLFEGDQPRVLPGFPRLKLWKNTLEEFGLDPLEFRRLRPGMDKFHYPVDSMFCATPQELTAAYVLQPGNFPEVRIRSLSGMEKLEGLRPHLYKIRFRDAIRNWPALLGKVCRLADRVSVNIVERPREGMSIEAVADAIDGHVRARHLTATR